VEIVAGPFPLDADQVRRCSAFGAAGSHDGIGLRYQYRCHARSLSICTWRRLFPSGRIESIQTCGDHDRARPVRSGRGPWGPRISDTTDGRLRLVTTG